METPALYESALPETIRSVVVSKRFWLRSDAPELTDTWTADPALRAHLERLLPDDVLSRVGPGLAELGVAAAVVSGRASKVEI